MLPIDCAADGTYSGYEQPGVGANGFQDILSATLMAALEWGLFPYARGVLTNCTSPICLDRSAAFPATLLPTPLGDPGACSNVHHRAGLTYYQRPHGAVLYRGLEMPQQGRLLTILAMY